MTAERTRFRFRSVRTAAISIAVSVATVLGAGVLAAPASAAQATATATNNQMIEKILADTNAVRADAGMGPLVRNSKLDAVAATWSDRQVDAGAMSHNPSFSSQIPAGWSRAGENAATGYSYTTVVAAWRASAGHYANLIGDYTDIGIGISFASNGTAYYTQNFAKYSSSAQAAARAPAMGTGAVSVKGPASELIPGATIEIRKNDCSGGAVWRTTTTSNPNAYGAFGISLEVGTYCVVTLSAPGLYDRAPDFLFTMKAKAGNWFTAWLPGAVTGAVVAKDQDSNGVNGFTALTRMGTCDSPGAGVWQNTTSSNRWSTGGYGIALKAGTYCTTVVSTPVGYSTPAPIQSVVTAPGPIWITLWTARRS